MHQINSFDCDGTHLVLSKTYLLNNLAIGNTLLTLFYRGYSSAGRASALQAGGRRFDPD